MLPIPPWPLLRPLLRPHPLPHLLLLLRQPLRLPPLPHLLPLPLPHALLRLHPLHFRRHLLRPLPPMMLIPQPWQPLEEGEAWNKDPFPLLHLPEVAGEEVAGEEETAASVPLHPPLAESEAEAEAVVVGNWDQHPLMMAAVEAEETVGHLPTREPAAPAVPKAERWAAPKVEEKVEAAGRVAPFPKAEEEEELAPGAAKEEEAGAAPPKAGAEAVPVEDQDTEAPVAEEEAEAPAGDLSSPSGNPSATVRQSPRQETFSPAPS